MSVFFIIGVSGFTGIRLMKSRTKPWTYINFTTVGAGTWTVPTDWNNLENRIECIGGGAGAKSGGGGAGGGGAYAALSNYSLTVGATIDYFVASGGAGGSFSCLW